MQRDVVGINFRNHVLVHENNPGKHHFLANDKAVCKTVLHKHHIPTPETYALVRGMNDIPKALKAIRDKEAVAIKPASGSGGSGILILKNEGDGTWSKPSGKILNERHLTWHLANILYGMFSKGESDQAIIEYCLKPHPFFENIYSQGVPDFRIIMLGDQRVMAMLRMPTAESDGKANLHAGAIGIGVDLETGELKTGFDGKQRLNRHPDSAVRFAGLILPEWEKTLRVAQETARLFPLAYLGIDIVFDAVFGPMVIEINIRPGISIQNVNREGLKAAIGRLEEEKSEKKKRWQ